MKSQKFKFIDDLTSDVMFEAYGNSLKEVFENSALAMSSVICKIKKIKPIKSIQFEVRGYDRKDLLINWLSELIAMVDVEEMFFCKFEILEIGDTHLKAKCYGQDMTPELGETVVKAVTYYNFDLVEKNKIFTATITVDI